MSGGLAQIDASELTVGMYGVFYRYSKRPNMSLEGPFYITHISRDNDGDFVHIKHDYSLVGEGRRVYLADDDDYGYPCFYVRQP